MAGPADEETIPTLVGQLVDETRDLASAEITLYKARIAERFSAYKSAIIFFATAGVLALAALVALLVGLILSLATVIGPGLATAAVVLTVLVIAALLGMIGKGRLAAPKLDPRP